MLLSRFTHVSALIWNPLPHYPHSILLLIKYLLKILLAPNLLFHFTATYSLVSFRFQLYVLCCECGARERWVFEWFWTVCACVQYCQLYYLVHACVRACVSLCFSVCGGYGSIPMTCKPTSDRINRNFLLNHQRDNHENDTICKWSNWCAGGLGKILVYDEILLPFCLAMPRNTWDRRVKVILGIGKKSIVAVVWRNKHSAVEMGCE